MTYRERCFAAIRQLGYVVIGDVTDQAHKEGDRFNGFVGTSGWEDCVWTVLKETDYVDFVKCAEVMGVSPYTERKGERFYRASLSYRSSSYAKERTN